MPAPDSAQAIGWLALAVFCAIGGINQVLKFTDRFRETPPSHQTYATKTEHAQLAEKLDTELGRERGSRKKMHEEISKMQSDISAISTDNHAQSKDLADLKRQISATEQRIDAVPMRTIQLLRETQQLHSSKS
ncbi:hypothetical protein DB354_10120 [Opitutus sp. ER46]|nr:hypothetical protein DB354_10120 [Opitutus sp. ER46]